MTPFGSLRRLGVLAAAFAAGALLAAGPALSQQPGKLKVGLMLPYTGTYAALGNAITNGFKLAIEENGGKVAGREIEYFVVDDESDPAKATENEDGAARQGQAPGCDLHRMTPCDCITSGFGRGHARWAASGRGDDRVSAR